jgi:hypothetical protein
MAMTKEQLLIPRVMCVGTKEGTQNFPGSDYLTGTILEPDGKDAKGIYYYRLKNRLFIYIDEVENYPNCFRPMPWWEGRKPEDMPEYVTVNLLGSLQWMANEIKTGAVYKLDADFKYSYYKGHYLGIQYNNGGGALGEYLLPASEQEYNEYKNQKEG